MNTRVDDPWDHIYPLTIISDRYSGSYSGGAYTAWNLDFDCVPGDADGSDLDCDDFWRNYKRPVGKGNTPHEAAADLARQLAEIKKTNPNDRSKA